MKEERYLSETFGKANPFSVPNGYFDGFARQLMDSMPEKTEHKTSVGAHPCGRPLVKPKARVIPLMRYVRNAVAAACVCGAIIGGALLATNGGGSSIQAADLSEQYYSRDYAIERMADYTMIDNEDLYDYLAEE